MYHSVLVPGLYTWCLDDCLGLCLYLSVRMGFVSLTACKVDAISVGMSSDKSELPEDEHPIEQFV